MNCSYTRGAGNCGIHGGSRMVRGMQWGPSVMTRFLSRFSARVPLLALALLAASSFDNPRAAADTGTLGVQVGAVQLQGTEGESWRPTLRSDFAFDLSGSYLQAGGWMLVTAEAFPLKHPALGGGVLVALRPQFACLRPVVEAAAGRVQLPTSQRDQVSAWSVSLTGGLGVEVSDDFFLEARLAHTWLYDLPAESAVRDRTWTVTGGIGVDL